MHRRRLATFHRKSPEESIEMPGVKEQFRDEIDRLKRGFRWRYEGRSITCYMESGFKIGRVLRSTAGYGWVAFEAVSDRVFQPIGGALTKNKAKTMVEHNWLEVLSRTLKQGPKEH